MQDRPALRKLMSLEIAAGGLLRTALKRGNEGWARLRMHQLTNTGPHRKLKRVRQSVEVELRATTVEDTEASSHCASYTNELDELVECVQNQSTRAPQAD